MGFECFGKGSDALLNNLIDRSITEIKSNVSYLGSMVFNNCKQLTQAEFYKAANMDSCVFRYCNALKRVDFYCLQKLMNESFTSCSKLDTLIIRTNTLCTLVNINAFTNTPISTGTGYIYVPAALLEEYKVATNWVTYADRFRAIEDYSDIWGGV